MLFLLFLQSLSISLLQKSAGKYGDEAVAAIGIVLRIVTLGSNVIFGLCKGFAPIAGYSYGAKDIKRLKECIKVTMKWSTLFCIVWSVALLLFASDIVGWFSKDHYLIGIGSEALRANLWLFFTFGFQFVYSTLFLSIGKAKEGFLLSISRQGIFFIPVILTLPNFFGLNGVLYTQAFADIFTTIVTAFMAYTLHAKMNTKTFFNIAYHGTNK